MSAGALAVATLFLTAVPAWAQTPANVRVVKASRIQRWLRAPVDVLLNVEPGTTLEVLDKEGDWYWIVVPPDTFGTSRSGWIRAGNVEPVVALAVAIPAQQQNQAEVPNVPPASAASATANAGEDKVTITVTEKHDEAASADSAASYTFDEVHFDRNRYALRPEDMDVLRAAVTALKTDPALAVNIEGYTCSLGTTAYNQALGLRRANAVKDFLVSEGIAEDRLHTISLGETHPKYDNTHEKTRRLNRRVALVPNAQR